VKERKVWKRVNLTKRSRSYKLKPTIYSLIKEKGEISREEIYKYFPSNYKNLIDGILGELEKEGEIILGERIVKVRKQLKGVEL